jgi:hypothetical protein
MVVRLAFVGNEVLDLNNNNDEITLQGQSAALTDAHVTLLDSGGNFVDSNHDQLVHTASADGPYFIAVDDGNGTTGTYDLSVDPLGRDRSPLGMSAGGGRARSRFQEAASAMRTTTDQDTSSDTLVAPAPLGQYPVQWEWEDCFYVILHPAFRTFRYDSREQAQLAIARYLETGHPALDRGRVRAPGPAEPRPHRGPRARLASLAATLLGPLGLWAVALVVVALPNGAAILVPPGWRLALLC